MHLPAAATKPGHQVGRGPTGPGGRM